MEELFEQLLHTCLREDVTSIENACTLLGLNYFKILEYSSEDDDAKGMLRMCIGMCRNRVFEKYYFGSIAKNEADVFVAELNSIEEIYLNVPTQPVDEN